MSYFLSELLGKALSPLAMPPGTTTTPNVLYSSGESSTDGSRAVVNGLYDGDTGTLHQHGGPRAREQSAVAHLKELVLKLKVGLGASCLLVVVLFIVMLTKQCDECHANSTEVSAESRCSGGGAPNTTAGEATTSDAATYTLQSCRGVGEASGCGSRIPLSDCDDDGNHGGFARQHCPQMCGLGCTPTSTVNTTTTTATTATVTTTTTATATATAITTTTTTTTIAATTVTTTTATITTATTTTPPAYPWGDASLILQGGRNGSHAIFGDNAADATKAADLLPTHIEEIVGSQFITETTTWELLYRGSRDGFAASDFHNKCDHQGATVTVVQDVYGVFGGVTGVPWGTSAGLSICVATTKAFLFDIRCDRSPFGGRPPTIYKLQTPGNGFLYSSCAMVDDPEYGPTFGTVGTGLHIATNANANANSKRNLGFTYTADGITHNDHPWNFQLSEIEVFFKLVAG